MNQKQQNSTPPSATESIIIITGNLSWSLLNTEQISTTDSKQGLVTYMLLGVKRGHHPEQKSYTHFSLIKIQSYSYNYTLCKIPLCLISEMFPTLQTSLLLTTPMAIIKPSSVRRICEHSVGILGMCCARLLLDKQLKEKIMPNISLIPRSNLTMNAVYLSFKFPVMIQMFLSL